MRSRTLKQLSMHTCIGEGNGNPLQYSCLEKPRDREAWWAIVHGMQELDMTQCYLFAIFFFFFNSINKLEYLSSTPLSLILPTHLFH